MSANLAPDLQQQAVPAVSINDFVIANSDYIIKSPATFSLPAVEITVLALILALLQIADGVLTGVGVAHMGTDMEANPLLRGLMEIFGPTSTLVVVKTVAIGIIAVLASLSSVVPWIVLAFRGMVALYTLVAVLPWSAILFRYFN